MTDLLNTLNEFKPELAGRYIDLVTHQFERMTARLGPSLKGVGNDWDFARIWRVLVRPLTERTPEGYVLSAEHLAAAALLYADETVAEWHGKISGKLGELTDASVHRMDSVTFMISGTRDGRRVTIEQQMIVNVSKLGRPFNQFPARIKLDGKPISEAAYRKAA